MSLRRPDRLDRPARRWTAPASLVAVLVLVALGAALFAALAARRSTSAPAATGPHLGIVQPGAPLPQGVDVTDFVPVSADEYWATGEVVTNQRSGWPDASFVLHYRGGRWLQVGSELRSVQLAGVQMVSTSEGWVWGRDNTDTAVLLHITDGTWQRVSVLAADPSGSPDLLRMRTADDGWLVWLNPKDSSGMTSPSSLLHYANGTWHLVQTPLSFFTDIAPVHPDEAWLLGADGQSSALVHLVNGHVSLVWRVPNADELSSLQVLGPNDIWAMGARPPAESNAAHNGNGWIPVLYHYDGKSWRPVNVQAPDGVEQVQLVAADEMWATRSATTAIRPGYLSPSTERRIQALYHYRSGRWQQVTLPYADLIRLVVLPAIPATTSSASGEMWALGYYTVWTPQPSAGGGSAWAGFRHTVVLHYGNGTWTVYGR